MQQKFSSCVYWTIVTNAKFLFGIPDSDLSFHKYSDNDHKDDVLLQAAVELNHPTVICTEQHHTSL
jgi:hypothetical protein